MRSGRNLLLAIWCYTPARRLWWPRLRRTKRLGPAGVAIATPAVSYPYSIVRMHQTLTWWPLLS